MMYATERLRILLIIALPIILNAGLLNAMTRLCMPAHANIDSSSDVLDSLVVGCGLSGASTAFYLDKAGLNVRVAESLDCVGGVVSTNSGNGFQWEEGPNSFQPNAAILRFLKDLHMLEELVLADPKLPRFVYFNGTLHKLPMKMIEAITFSLLTIRGKLHAMRGLIRPWAKRPFNHEESIKEFATRHFGPEVFERLVDPFVSGVYAGDPDKLTIKAAMKKIHAMEILSKGKGMLEGIIKKMSQSASEKTALAKVNADLPTIPSGSLGSLHRGMHRLPQKVREVLGEQKVLVNHRLTGVKREGELFVSTFEVTTTSNTASDAKTTETKVLRSRSLVITTPAYVTAPLLDEDLLPGVAAPLDSIYYPPVSVVVLAYPDNAFKVPMKGFGHLIPRSTKVRTLGNIWASSLFPGRAPAGHVLMSQFIGGAQDPSVASLTEQELIDTAHNDNLKTVLKPGGPIPQVIAVKRWIRAIPQYERGHVEKVAVIQDMVKTQPGLFVGGNYMTGVAVGDCIQYGMDVAKEVQSYLASPR